MSMAGSSAAWMIPTMSYSRRRREVKGQQSGEEPQEDDRKEDSRDVDEDTDTLQNLDGPLCTN